MALPLILAGTALAAQLGGAIYNATQQPKRKREYEKSARRQVAADIDRAWLQQLGYPTMDFDSAVAARDIKEKADQNFRVDPMTFVPFVQSAAGFASQAYDAANSGPPGQRAPTNDVLEAQAAQRAAAEAAERAKAMKWFDQHGWQGYGRR